MAAAERGARPRFVWRMTPLALTTLRREGSSANRSSRSTAAGIPSRASCAPESSSPPAVISCRKRSSTIRTAWLVAARPSCWRIPASLDERRTSSTDGICRSKSRIFVAGTPVFHQMAARGTSKLLELLTMASAHLELASVVQHKQIITALKSTKLLDAIEVHDDAAMDAAELLWIQALFDGVDGGTNAKHLAGSMNLHVVCRGGEMLNFAYRLEENPILRTDDDLFRILANFP